ncbi:MAG: spore coat protein CotJB [Eubacteriales bacterium]
MNMTRRELLKKLMDIDFVIHETVLYLDGHPNNKKALDYYKTVQEEQKEIYNQYATQFGPVTAENVKQDTWTWINEPWPWQNEREGNE